MADKINEIISPEAFAQLEKLTADLNESAAAMKQLAEYARGLDFSKAKSLSDLGQWAQDYEKNLNAMSAANQNYANNLQKAIVLKQQLNGSTKSVVDTYDKLEAAELKAAKAAEIRERTAQKAAAETEKASKREEKALRELNNEYELLKRAYKDAADKAKELGISFGTNSKIFKDAASNAKVMYDRLLKVEMAVGQGQRAVGQYNQAAFAMQQILRDTPAFAYSFSTGLLAISNNIPILVDEINRLKESNKKLVSEGGKALPIWKDVFASMFTGAGIISLVTAGITILAARLTMAAGGLTEAEKAANKLNEKLIELNDTINESYETEVKASGALLRSIQSLELPYKTRLEALDELIKKYPQLLGYLDKEKLLTGQQGNVLDVLANVSNVEARIKEFEGTVKILAEERRRLLIEQQEYEKTDQGFIGTWRSFTNLFGNESDKRKEKISELTKKIEDYKDSLRISKDELKFITNPQRPQTGRIREDIEADIKKYEHIRDISAETSQEHINANRELVKLSAELDRFLNKKTKPAKDTTLKSESDLLQAIYDNKQKELEITRDTNKAIADDTTKEMADRLVAHENYLAAVLELAKNERDRTIDLEGEKLDEIDRLKQKAKGKELANLIEQQRAAMIRVNTAQMEFNGKQKEVVEKGQKEVIDIVASSNNEWAKDEEKKNEKLKEMQLQAYLVEEELLRRALDNKEITRKEYNTRLKDLQKKQNIAFLQNEVELYDKLLANEQLADDKREEYRKKRNAAQKSLFNAQQGVQTKRSGRITDSLAMMLGIGDEEALQAFYDRTIDLVNRATDAIIAAKQRQYQAELSVLDKQKEGIQSNYDMQLALINATGKSEQDKANKISQLNAQRLTQEAIIEQKKREIAQKQAQFEKTAAIAAIIQNTAVAISSALKYGPAAPPIIALIAASGAAQLAAASNAPIPAYKEGTDNHIGGAFIAGDGGEPELIVAPNKRPYWSNSVSTLYNEGAGTKVIPMSDIMQYTTTNTEDFSAAQLDALANRIAKSFDKTGYKIAQVIQSSKPQDNSRAIGEAMRNQFNLQGK